MRRIVLTSSTAIALTLAAVLAAPVSAGSSGVLAAGSFTLVFGHDSGSHRTFSFVVTEGPGGTVAGQAQWILRGGEVVHININCFTRVGNQAIVGGTGSTPDVNSAAWAIQDNPDIIGFVAFTDDPDNPENCDTLLPNDGFATIGEELDAYGVPIVQGNVAMRP